ncbi:hypothetical protein BSNK01_24910 [Bacillaceae bacterium]
MNRKKLRALSCFILALALLFYAVPRVPLAGESPLATGFSVLWLSFALLVVGANLHHALGLDYEEQLERRKRRWQRQRSMLPARRRRPGRISVDWQRE